MNFNFIEFLNLEERGDTNEILVFQKEKISLLSQDKLIEFLKNIKTSKKLFFTYNLNKTAIKFLKYSKKDDKFLKIKYLLIKNNFYYLKINLWDKEITIKNFSTFFSENYEEISSKDFIKEKIDFINEKCKLHLKQLKSASVDLNKIIFKVEIMNLSLNLLNKEFSYIKKWPWYYNSLPGLSLALFKNILKDDQKLERILYQKNFEFDIFKNFFRGGRCEVIGNKFKDDFITSIDYNSMFGQMMEEFFFFGPWEKIDIRDNRTELMGDGVYLISIKENSFLPVLPQKLSMGSGEQEVYFTNGVKKGYYTYDAIKLCLDNGGKIEKIYSYYKFQNKEKIFKEFSDICQKKRKEGYFSNYLYKKIIVSLYGRLGLSPYTNTNLLIKSENYKIFFDKNENFIITEIWIEDWVIIELKKEKESLDLELLNKILKGGAEGINSSLIYKIEISLKKENLDNEIGGFNINKIELTERTKTSNFYLNTEDSDSNNTFFLTNFFHSLNEKIKKKNSKIKIKLDFWQDKLTSIKTEDFDSNLGVELFTEKEIIGRELLIYLNIWRKQKLIKQYILKLEQEVLKKKTNKMKLYGVENINNTKTSVVLAAQIADKSRNKLYNGLKFINNFNGRLLYWDTDSYFIAFNNENDKKKTEEFFSLNEKVKIEKKEIKDAVFVSNKLYALKFTSGEEEIKISGLIEKNISFEEIKLFFFEEKFLSEKKSLKIESIQGVSKFQDIEKKDKKTFNININTIYKKRIFSLLKHQTNPWMVINGKFFM